MNLNDIDEGNRLYLRIAEVDVPSPKEMTPETPVGETGVVERSVSVVVDEVEPDSVIVTREPFGKCEQLAVNPDHLYPNWRPPEDE